MSYFYQCTDKCFGTFQCVLIMFSFLKIFSQQPLQLTEILSHINNPFNYCIPEMCILLPHNYTSAY